MTDREIADYVKSNKAMIEGVLRILRGRVRDEDLEDARQELYMVMLKCLQKYVPERGKINTYMWASLYRKAVGLLKGFIVESIGAPIPIQTIKTSDDNEGVMLEGIADEPYFQEVSDARIAVNDLMQGLTPEVRDMLSLWSQHYTLKYIASKYNLSHEGVRKKIKKALSEMAKEEP